MQKVVACFYTKNNHKVSTCHVKFSSLFLLFILFVATGSLPATGFAQVNRGPYLQMRLIVTGAFSLLVCVEYSRTCLSAVVWFPFAIADSKLETITCASACVASACDGSMLITTMRQERPINTPSLVIDRWLIGKILPGLSVGVELIIFQSGRHKSGLMHMFKI